jgi:hypothetical protein
VTGASPLPADRPKHRRGLAVGLHFGIDYLSERQGAPAGLGSSTIVLYLAVTLGVQRYITQQRAVQVRSEVQ